MQIDGAIVKEQGVTFAIVIVKPRVIQITSLANSARESFATIADFSGLPIILAAQDSQRNFTYQAVQTLCVFSRILIRLEFHGSVTRFRSHRVFTTSLRCLKDLESCIARRPNRMSVNSIQSSITSIQRDIQSAQRQLTDKTKDEASKTSRIASIQKSITKNTSASTVQAKLREIERLQDDIVRIQSAKADATKKIADKTQRLHSLQQDLFKAQQREQESALKKIKRSQDENAAAQRRQLYRLAAERSNSSVESTGDAPNVNHDVFISHASEDKDDIVRPLAELLRDRNFDVWYDEFQLRVGDSLRRSIDQGLAKSRFGIVVLSPAFFAKNWPQYELDGLVQREMGGSKVILPVWHKVTKAEVIGYSPSLADKLALSTATATLEEMVTQIADVLAS